MKNYKAYKIVITVILAMVTVLSSIFMIDIITTEEGLGQAVGLVLWLVFGAPSFAVCMILSLIGVILSAINKNKRLCSAKTLIYFVIFTILPAFIFGATLGSFYILVG